jgi:putative tryptophan/tyrosine transport system substrate-binding protein
MTTRRQLLLLASAFAACAPATSLAQGRKVPRVGVLHAGNAKEPDSVQREPFERGLRELGWRPGSTILIEYRYAEGDISRLPGLAEELVRSGVDVMVARSTAAISAARRASGTIPIVMSSYSGDPVRDGIAKSMSRPGGNVTGMAGHADLDVKRLELLKDALPNIRRVAVVANPTTDRRAFAARMATLEANAQKLRIQTQIYEVMRAQQLTEAFEAIGKAHHDALLVRGDPEVLDIHRVWIAARAAELRLPAIYWWRFFVEAGGLMSYGQSIPAFHHRSADFVHRILKGAKAGDIAIEQPSKFEFVLNLRAAQGLGIEIPKAVTFRADEIVQ